VTELVSPVKGEIVAVNHTLIEQPGLINSSAMEEAWFMEVNVEQVDDTLLTVEQYGIMYQSGN
jgi:glycine cleavage system H protein